jgi:uncharacterized FAD-dependent dehydrogenase
MSQLTREKPMRTKPSAIIIGAGPASVFSGDKTATAFRIVGEGVEIRRVGDEAPIGNTRTPQLLH